MRVTRGRAWVRAFSHRHLTSEVLLQSLTSTCGICGGQSGTGTRFPPNTSVSLLSIITPKLHTHSGIHNDVISVTAQYSHVAKKKRYSRSSAQLPHLNCVKHVKLFTAYNL